MGEDEGLAVMMAPEIWIKTGGVSVNENLDHPGNKNTPPRRDMTHLRQIAVSE